jgi:RND family efflux transporter MFP subunit
MAFDRNVGLFVGLGLILIAGCRKAPPAYVAPPPPEVTVAKPLVRTLPQTLDFTGFTRGVEQVDIRAKVRGTIVEKLVDGGRFVQAGAVLFVVDPVAYQAAVDQARAEVESRQAAATLAQINLDRKQQAASGISKFEIDQAVAERDAAVAQVKLAAARVVAAEKDLNDTKIVAPISGRLGIDTPDVGQLVGDNAGQVLARIVNDETIYVRYDVPEDIVLQLRRRYANQRPGEGSRPIIPVYAGFANDVGHPYRGEYFRSDIGFDQNSGTVAVDAIFDNRNGVMLPGAFARVRSIVGEETVTLVPDVAVQVDLGGRFVLVVDQDNKVQRINVTVGDVVDRLRKIRDPDFPTDARVIINGLQRARPGAAVNPIESTLGEPRLDTSTDQPATRPG